MANLGNVLDSVSSPITRRMCSMALDECLAWFRQEPRPAGFCKATVSAWRASLETRDLESSSILIRMSAVRRLAATDCTRVGGRHCPREEREIDWHSGWELAIVAPGVALRSALGPRW